MVNDSRVSDFVFSCMIIGDFVALFTIFAVLIYAFHFFVIRAKPSLCYYDPYDPPLDLVDDVSERMRKFSSKIKRRLSKDRESLGKKVSFEVNIDAINEPEEAIYEEPMEVKAKVLLGRNTLPLQIGQDNEVFV